MRSILSMLLFMAMSIHKFQSSIVPKIPFLKKRGMSSGKDIRSIRVITDIDDTVKSSGGVRLFGIALGGIDTQYERGHFYPGAIQFAFELSKHRVSVPAKLSVLTARAREFKFALALKPNGKLCNAYRSIGEKHGHDDWGIGEVYYGSVKEWIFQDRKGLRKFRNFEKLLQNDPNPNHKYIFVGDTGEKDEDAGERILAKYAGRVKAIFLHSVSDSPDRSTVVHPRDRFLNGIPIFYFKTYVSAAVKAFQHNLMSADALVRVIDQAKLELHELDPHPEYERKIVVSNSNTISGIMSNMGMPSSTAAFIKSSRWEELEADIQWAKVFIKDIKDNKNININNN